MTQQNMKSYQKVVKGQVIQEYLLNKEGKYVCIEQYFEPEKDPFRQDEGETVHIDTTKEVSQDFDMVQPAEKQGFDEWFEENKNSTLLQEKFLSCLNDDPDMTQCFKDWAKAYFNKTLES